ncbi:hypothetical protein T4B_14490 [Trichinella pseudospiralis]|uniref:Uncharacterized protein n=1 Tax=Trichinella pseudospiralis TaxID=6337 RepID=A0A0V1KD36_TRIPS|nr:hypothetical protein T4A_7956 [Trichinella pseudospiralis]KRZ32335.1 hypothetical protein T4B_14490 [Trichinella pseudospiralis]KRZ45114.1 hypothetical protein T4C_14017 [Trichinella pseudospiralis]
MEEALPIPTLTAAALEAMDTVRRYICSFNVDKNVINQLSKMDTNYFIDQIRLPGAVARCERCAILGTLCDVSSLHESGLSLIFGLLIFQAISLMRRKFVVALSGADLRSAVDDGERQLEHRPDRCLTVFATAGRSL